MRLHATSPVRRGDQTSRPQPTAILYPLGKPMVELIIVGGVIAAVALLLIIDEHTRKE